MKTFELKAPAYASLALAFASFGDAFLYPFLPVNNSVVGVPVVWVGVLLSINRFVRIFSNGWMVQLFSKYGLRTIMVAAVVLAIASTAGYAFAGSVCVWLLLRICWGIAFSAMRIGTIGYAIQQNRQGFALGLSKSLQEAGPMLALFLTPFLLNSLTSRDVFVVLFLLSMPALFFAWKLPVANDNTQSYTKRTLLSFPSSYNLITVLSAILIDGIMIVVLGSLFLTFHTDINLFTATALAAFYLGYRRICLVALAPLGGGIADRIGVNFVFNVTIILVVAGLIILISGWIEAGVIVVFTFYSINSAVTPAVVIHGKLRPLNAVAENATWRDLGAALGTLLGGFLLTSSHLNSILLIAIFMLVIIILIHLGKNQKFIKPFVAWK